MTDCTCCWNEWVVVKRGMDMTVPSEKIIHWINADHEIWVFFNNDFGGFAIQNALHLSALLSNI